MTRRLFSLYQRKRWININVNAITAAAVSTLMVMGLIWILKHPLNATWSHLGFTVFALLADIVLDVACFLALHWVANHWRPVKGRTEKECAQLDAKRPNSLFDMIRVQTERLAIGPLYYLLASGGMLALLHAGVHPSWATGIGYGTAIIITRTLHTIWGLRTGSYRDHHARPEAVVAAAGSDRVPEDDDAERSPEPAPKKAESGAV